MGIRHAHRGTEKGWYFDRTEKGMSSWHGCSAAGRIDDPSVAAIRVVLAGLLKPIGKAYGSYFDGYSVSQSCAVDNREAIELRAIFLCQPVSSTDQLIETRHNEMLRDLAGQFDTQGLFFVAEQFAKCALNRLRAREREFDQGADAIDPPRPVRATVAWDRSIAT